MLASPAGARGFGQFMESTAEEYGLEVSNDVDERYHLENNLPMPLLVLFKKSTPKIRRLDRAVAASYIWARLALQKTRRAVDCNYK